MNSIGIIPQPEEGIAMENIMIYHHLGLGDHFICNGLVRYLYESIKPARLYLPVKKHNFITVSRMYADLPAIIPLAVNKDKDVENLPQNLLCDRVIRVGFSKTPRRDFDVSFYDMTGVPFSVRWDYFKVVRDGDREKLLEEIVGVKDGDRFVLVHNVSSTGKCTVTLHSDLRRIVVSPLTDCLLDWCSLVEKAEEVHCIDSAFIHLAQTLNVRRGVFHNVRPTTKKFTFELRKDWETIEYRV
jgi:hypothetical protein